MRAVIIPRCLSIGLLACLAVRADTVNIINPSFENYIAPLSFCGPPTQGCWNHGPIPGWTEAGSTFGSWQIGTAMPATDGSIVAYGLSGMTLYQDLNISLEPKTVYSLQVDVGEFPGDGAAEYGVALMTTDGTLLAGDSSTGQPATGWITSSVKYTSPAFSAEDGRGLLIELVVIGPSGNQREFDNVRMTENPANVPEPNFAVVPLLALGGALVFGRRNRGITAKPPQPWRYPRD
jgi:hypothetical protein